jgi:hypothetical protein
MEACLTVRVAYHPPSQRGGALSPEGGLARTPGGGRTIPPAGPTARGSGPSCPTARGSPCGHDGTARPSPRPHDATAQQACDRGKNTRPLLKNLRLLKRAWCLLCLSETPPGRVHDQRLADRTPYPRPGGSPLRQD